MLTALLKKKHDFVMLYFLSVSHWLINHFILEINVLFAFDYENDL